MKKILIEILTACFIVVLSAQADVLELKNGKVLNGKYLGGTQQSIRFQVGDKVEVISKDAALALTFSGSANTGSESSTSLSKFDLRMRRIQLVLTLPEAKVGLAQISALDVDGVFSLLFVRHSDQNVYRRKQ